MDCWHCDRPAKGTCRFCGRGLCREHAKLMPYVITVFRNKKDLLRGVAVAQTLYCGECRPQDDPVSLDELDEA